MVYPNNFKNAITFEVSLNKNVHFRRVYSGFELLADVGGLFSSIRPVCILLITIINFYSKYQYLMADLFVERIRPDFKETESDLNLKQKGKKTKDKSSAFFRRMSHHLELRNDVQWNARKSFKLNLQAFLPHKYLSRCCQPNRIQRLKAKGFKQVLQEVEISNIVKQLRVLKGAVKKNLN